VICALPRHNAESSSARTLKRLRPGLRSTPMYSQAKHTGFFRLLFLPTWEYIGVDLRPGRNLFERAWRSMISALCRSAQITCWRREPLNRIVIEAPPRAVRMPPRRCRSRFLLRDADGLPVAAALRSRSVHLGQWQFPGEAQGSLAHPSADSTLRHGVVARLLLFAPGASRPRSSSA